uniref:Uncharacterized protein TCIL3000_11_8940 n=1 Tax=Trypanosoma congolense (strain IL3000) TaxID=1068625 RepID=G0V1B6_TRYCI|nr:unnamed protein product [Trypanosoma congolense IL3000]
MQLPFHPSNTHGWLHIYAQGLRDVGWEGVFDAFNLPQLKTTRDTNGGVNRNGTAHMTNGEGQGWSVNETGIAVPSLYALLGVPPTVSQADLARRFKQLSLQFHPDRAAYRSGDDELAVQQMYQKIVEAYEVLSNPEHRIAYDTKCGVNFSSRVAALRQALAQNETTPAPHCPGGFGAVKSPQATDEEDDDEEYTP